MNTENLPLQIYTHRERMNIDENLDSLPSMHQISRPTDSLMFQTLSWCITEEVLIWKGSLVFAISCNVINSFDKDKICHLRDTALARKSL
jgi:hypothetical protein